MLSHSQASALSSKPKIGFKKKQQHVSEANIQIDSFSPNDQSQFIWHLPPLCRANVVSHHHAMVTHIKGGSYTSITAGAVDGHEVLLF